MHRGGRKRPREFWQHVSTEGGASFKSAQDIDKGLLGAAWINREAEIIEKCRYIDSFGFDYLILLVCVEEPEKKIFLKKLSNLYEVVFVAGMVEWKFKDKYLCQIELTEREGYGTRIPGTEGCENQEGHKGVTGSKDDYFQVDGCVQER